MPTRSWLLVCLPLLVACGDAAAPGPDPAEAPPRLSVREGEVLAVRLLEDGSIRWVTRESPQGTEEALTDERVPLGLGDPSGFGGVVRAMKADDRWRLVLGPRTPWIHVERVLAAVRVHGGVLFEGAGPHDLLHVEEEPLKPALHVRVTLEQTPESGRRLRLAARGRPWVRRHGCGDTGGEHVQAWADWDAEALAGLDGALRQVAALLEEGETGLAVRLAAQASVPAVEVLGVRRHLGATGVANVRFAQGRMRRRVRNVVEEALEWLHAHQSSDGRWSSASFDRVCDGAPMPEADLGVGEAGYDLHATSLALLAFLGAGYTDRGKHPFARTVGRGRAWLQAQQREDGFVGARDAAGASEGHVLATFYFASHLGMRRAAKGTDDALARALTHLPSILAERAPSELRTLGWTLCVQASLEASRRERPSDTGATGLPAGAALDAALGPALLDASARHDVRGDALQLLGRILGGEDPRRSQAVKTLAVRVGQHRPTGESADPWYVFFATHGLFQVGGRSWKTWNEYLRPAVRDTIDRTGSPCCRCGSWPASGPDRALGGRLAATALHAMALQTYYAHGGLFQPR